MLKKILILIICLAILSGSGCSSILRGDTLSISPHSDSAPAQTSDAIEIINYHNLIMEITNIVESHKSSETFRFTNYDGDVEDDVPAACLEVSYSTPLGAYAVYYMSSKVSRVVSYYEAEILITYKKSSSQINNVINASTLTYLNLELFNMLRDHMSYKAINTYATVKEADILTFLENTYYSNPLEIMMFPEIEVSIYPENGVQKIVEVAFSYNNNEQSFTAMKNSFSAAIRRITDGVTDKKLYNLLFQLIETTELSDMVVTTFNYDRQNPIFTAYGALQGGLAASEGFAMAYKALCDSVDLTNYVVRGRKDGAPHSWNIVQIGNDYYHVDPAMCRQNGIESAFLMSDADIQSDYWWDTEQYKACNGAMTYASYMAS